MYSECFVCAVQVTTGESRARMGEVAHQRSDFVILADSDPGLEDPREIIQVRTVLKTIAASQAHGA